LNKFDTSLKTEGGGATLNNLDDQYSRPEAWRLLLRECQSGSWDSGSFTGSNDGAMGFVGPDYGGPYPDFNRKYAIRYRDERTKRPLNVRNIRTTTGSAVHGNFDENYEVLHTFGRKENDQGWRRTSDTVGDVLSPFFDGLPVTTQEASLIGVGVTKATATITIADLVTVDDTLTFGDGVLGPDVFTFKNAPAFGDFIIDGINLGTAITRSNIKSKLEARYNVSITINGNDLEITNNNAGAVGNVSLSETFTTASNNVSGFTGGNGGGGNVVMNFNNTNRIPLDVKEQQKFDADSRGKTVVATRFSAPGCCCNSFLCTRRL
jgi:hypothetical protein